MDGGVASDVRAGDAAPAARADAWTGLENSRRARRPWARLLRGASGKDVLAVLDQAVVSGTSFVTTILLWRWCGPGELGVYSLGFTLLVTWGCVQESLIALPYTLYRHRPLKGTPAEYAGSVLVHQGLLSALALITLAAAGVALSWGGFVPGLAGVTWVLALVMPFALFREFGRRFAFAHLGMAEALALDGTVAALQLAGLAALAWAGALSAGSAFATVGAACALTGAAWLYWARDEFAVRGSQWRATMRQSWTLGKWIFAGQLTLSVQAYFIHWLLAGTSGAAATGVYTACMSIALFSNPLILGISNALAPRTAQAFTEGGGGELRRVVFQTTALLAAAMALFCAAVFVGGDDVMALLYHGSQYEGHDHTVAVLALAMLASALGMPASNGLTAVERPDVVFKVSLVAVGLSVALVPFLVAEWGVTGAAYGFLAGNVAGSLGRWIAFTALVMKRGSPLHAAAVTRVLQQFIPGAGEGGWLIEPLNEGAQANIFTARAADRRPVWQEHGDLVVKLFKPAAHNRVEEARDQFEAMGRFHARLDRSAVNGWQVRAPVPLYHCDRPFALVMTKVPGIPLNACVADGGRVTPDVLAAIADAVVAGMERTWAVESQIHGDFNFDNILCDLASRTLSFVDPGVREDVSRCDGVSRRWYPASRDLAHLLFETEAGVKRTIVTPALRRRQRTLAEQVLRAYLRRVAPADQRLALLDEVHGCARVYLESLVPSWTLRGLWRRVVRRIATGRIDEVIRKLRAEVPSTAETCEG
jgi:O-antigen/teichoic acid export membrane protein